MNVFLFGGTTEGRTLSRELAARGAAVTVSVATDYGAEEQGEAAGVAVLTGRRSAAEMAALLRGFDLCIDATHPYAAEASRNIRAACEAAGVPLRRLLRAASDTEDLILLSTAEEAAVYLSKTEGNILLTTGSKELRAFAALDANRLYPRVLPSHEGIAACEAAGVPHRNIVAMQGPFSAELNAALIRQFHIAWVVTKDGGAAGGFPEKAAAARETGARLIVLRRPEEQGESLEDILRDCEAMLGCR